MDPEDAAIDASASGPDGLYTVKLYRRSDPLREPIKTTVADSTGKFQFFGVSSDPLFADYYAVEISNDAGVGHHFRKSNDGPLTENIMMVSRIPEAGSSGVKNSFIHHEDGVAIAHVKAVAGDGRASCRERV